MNRRLCDMVGIDKPIVQTGMGYVAYPPLVSAVCNAGALGILASATMTYPELEAAVAEVRHSTDNPFGVNLRADADDAARRIDLMGKAGVKVASFAQAPKPELIARAKDAGMIVIPSIGAVRHAVKVAEWGVDAVIVQGGEGGGHTGQVPTTLLLPQVVDAVGSQVAVIAAGGFFDGRGLVAALAYGAVGIAMGTRFLLTKESPVAANVKDVYLSKTVTDTVVSRQVDGVPHRVLKTPFVESLEKGRMTQTARALSNAIAFRKLSHMSWPSVIREGVAMKRSQELSWSQVVMAANTPMLLKAAMVDGHPELGVMASGQVVGMIEDLPTCQELVDRIMKEAEAIVSGL
jgi:NAD(P)H-dependent flavin oxidoreductase YrpB (nitropropane dioxygenase family)